jgi:hypothetical protein
VEDIVILENGDDEWEDIDEEDDDVFGFNADGDDHLDFGDDYDDDMDNEDDEDDDEMNYEQQVRKYRRRQNFKKLLKNLRQKPVTTTAPEKKTEPQKQKTPKTNGAATNEEKTEGKRRVSFSLKDNKVKVFEKASRVANSPITAVEPTKGLLKKRKIDQVTEQTRPKIKNPPLVSQPLKKRRK